MNQVTILVADDERLERTILCRKLLREFGDSCELLQAENGREAVNLFEEHHPQIAILDVMMPGFTGIEVAAQIRRKDPYCILVFLSAYSDFSYARQAIRLRAMDYLTKPYQKEELFAVMEEAIHQAKQNMQNPEYQKKCAGDTAPLLGVRSFDEKDGKNFDISEGVWEEDSDPQISKVVTYEITHFIEQNYMHEISMQDAAQFMHYSDTYFCKLFKQGFGCNFTTYLTQYRIERAEQLLRTTDLSVREVALRTGYGDSNYFTKVFKRKTGIVPSEYRAQQRKI